MSNLPFHQYLSYLASRLTGISDVYAKVGFLFFNTVKFVQFIRLLARYMNGRGGCLSVGALR